jgi:hypothetical protein
VVKKGRGIIWRSPLLLAALIAVGPLVWATHGMWLAPFRHTVATPQTGAAPKVAAHATPTPSPTPEPQLPMLAVADRLDLGAERAFGRIDVRGYAHYHDVSIQRYALAATPGAMPASLPVWKLRGFSAADVRPLQRRLGMNSSPMPAGQCCADELDPATATVRAGSAGNVDVFNLGVVPTGGPDIAAALTRMLTRLGIPAHDADFSASDYGDASRADWYVSFVRKPLQGVPVGLGNADTLVSAEVDGHGNVSRFTVTEQAVDGGAVYPLRTWREAWNEVSRGHWFDECCEVFTGGSGGPHKVAFRADKVSLVYEAVGSTLRTNEYLVPCYAFTDSAAPDLVLSVPALRLADLAEPGGFTVTEPGGG